MTGLPLEIQNIIATAKKDKDVLAVAFFGSYARGEKYRDIDICIFLQPKNYSDLELSKKKFKYASENEKYDLEVFQQLPLYIQIRVIKEAKMIHCKDQDAFYDLYFDTERQYEHFQPVYESYLEGVESG